jgi:hypothetical protein
VRLRPKSETVSDFGLKSELAKFYDPGAWSHLRYFQRSIFAPFSDLYFLQDLLRSTTVRCVCHIIYILILADLKIRTAWVFGLISGNFTQVQIISSGISLRFFLPLIKLCLCYLMNHFFHSHQFTSESMVKNVRNSNIRKHYACPHLIRVSLY